MKTRRAYPEIQEGWQRRNKSNPWVDVRRNPKDAPPAEPSTTITFIEFTTEEEVMRQLLTEASLHWMNAIDAMNDPSFEFEIDEFSLVFSAFSKLENLRLKIDPGLRAVMHALARQTRKAVDPD